MKTLTTLENVQVTVKTELPTLIATMKAIKLNTPSTGVRKIRAKHALNNWLKQFNHLVIETATEEVVPVTATKDVVSLPEFKTFEENFHPSHDWGFAQFDKFFELIGA